jgi:hypothetical protein
MHTVDTACISENQPSILSIVAPGGPEIKPKTLSEALAQAEAKGLLPNETLRQIGADLKAIARATGRSLEELPAAPADLRPILNRVLPKATRLSNKRWMNILSNLRRLLRAVGLHACPNRSELQPGTPWALLVEKITSRPRQAAFAGFARWCVTQGITPAEVKGDTNRRFCRLADRHDIGGLPRATTRQPTDHVGSARGRRSRPVQTPPGHSPRDRSAAARNIPG